MKYLMIILSASLLTNCAVRKTSEAMILCSGGGSYKATNELSLGANSDPRATVFEAKDEETGAVYLVPRSICILYIK